MPRSVLYAVPALVVAALLMVLEQRWSRRHAGAKGYQLGDTLANGGLGALKVSFGALVKLGALPLFAIVYDHRIANLGQPHAWWSWVVLLFAEDLCFYTFHRTHHAVRLLWAAHVSHHSSEYYNLSTAWRQTLLTTITSPVFWMPLALLGYSPWMILLAQGWSQLYQFALHTEAVRTLGPLEWFMNTPSHHRVHHGTQPQYLDRNHGGIFIIWDRLFGTFEPEGERVQYGLTRQLHTNNVWTILFHEVGDIARDARSATTMRGKLGAVFGRPR
ncbi:MAG TPA: sterol desaturase family protein [Kofleriaceae bacterium]|nr:sterol desaturase family protein [Kofleriaceae bacterium]